MAENSAIEWTDSTANFWWGCEKVSPGCKHCYADTLAKRYGKKIWGSPKNTTREQKKSVWNDVKKWDRQAGEEGKRINLFTMSMGDFLEDHPDIHDTRNRAIDLLYSLTNTNVQLLTKRPENARKFLPESWFYGGWPEHILFGVSVENQEQASIRIPLALDVPAKVRFLSCEPLLEGILLDDGMESWLTCNSTQEDNDDLSSGDNECCLSFAHFGTHFHGIDWVIAGGESGHHARPMHPNWARSLRDQCQEAKVRFTFKQWGEWLPGYPIANDDGTMSDNINWQSGFTRPANRYGNNVIQWGDGTVFAKTGKHTAGRLLDGREWNEMPLSV